MKKLLQGGVRFYRKFISPLKPPICRFYPTCSQYALEALEIHGAAKGSWLAVKRICKCHPFHPGGIDYVLPARKQEADAAADSGPASQAEDRRLETGTKRQH